MNRSAKRDLAQGGPVGERERRKPQASGLKPCTHDWGVVWIFLATGLFVAVVMFGSCKAKIDAKETGGCGVKSSHAKAIAGIDSGQPPIFSQPLSPSVAQSFSHSSEKAVAPLARRGEPWPAAGQPPVPPVGPGGRSLFDAIRLVESGGDDRAVGDGGRSRGPYQCGRAAWADGGGNPVDYDRLVWDRAACEAVMIGYWRRYGATTDEARARLWNGGPNWRTKPATAEYWRRVKGAAG